MMNKKITKRIVSFALAAIIAVGASALSSCTTRLVYDDGTFYCARNKVTYKELDFQYLPVSIGTEKYGELDENGTKTDIFTVENALPEEWLATADGRLFCAENISVPTLEELMTDKILICREGTELTISIAEITYDKSINTIVESMSSAPKVEYPEKGEASDLLCLRFSSEKYPWLYYNVSYVEFENDVCITDYVSDLSSYTEREIDDSVKKTVSSTYDCWYKISDDSIYESITEISEKTDVLSATVTKVNAEGDKDEYIGLLFSDKTSVEACIQEIVEKYSGEMSEDELRALLADPDMVESNIMIEYNYGKYLVYDRATGRCVKAPQILHEYKELTIHD